MDTYLCKMVASSPVSMMEQAIACNFSCNKLPESLFEYDSYSKTPFVIITKPNYDQTVRYNWINYLSNFIIQY